MKKIYCCLNAVFVLLMGVFMGCQAAVPTSVSAVDSETVWFSVKMETDYTLAKNVTAQEIDKVVLRITNPKDSSFSIVKEYSSVSEFCEKAVLPLDFGIYDFKLELYIENHLCQTGSLREKIDSEASEIVLATYYQTKRYKITYILNGATWKNGYTACEYYYGGEVVQLPDASKLVLPEKATEFSGWFWYPDFCGDVVEFISANVKGDITLYAKLQWPYYSVTYENCTGLSIENPNPSTYYYSELDEIQLKPVERTGFNFSGWYTDASFETPISKINCMEEKNLRLFAKWTTTKSLLGDALRNAYEGEKIVVLGYFDSTTWKNVASNSYGASKKVELDLSGVMNFTSFIAKNYSSGKGNNIIKKVLLPETITELEPYTFVNFKAMSEIELPKSVTSVSLSAFSGCSELKDFSFLKNVNLTGNPDFRNCLYLQEIDLPESVTLIGDYAFEGCSSLSSITIPNMVTSIGTGAFSGCSLFTGITIPDSVTTVGGYVFKDCTSLAEISLPDTLENIDSDFLNNCEAKLNLNLSHSTMQENLKSAYGQRIKTVVIEDFVTVLGDGVFQECTELEEITIPESVTTIGQSAFQGCASITEINLPSSVTTIGQSAFQGCTSITEINLPSSVTTIEQSAFQECTLLTEIIIPDSVTTVGGYVFKDCSSLVVISLPDTLENIDSHFLSNCDAKVHLTISHKNPQNLISTCRSRINSVVIEDSVKSIGSFKSCVNLEEITIAESVTGLAQSAFENCKSLTTITLPTSVTTIAQSAFKGCTSLTEITIPPSVTSIGWSAFYGCALLKEIVIPSTVTKIEALAFYGCTSLTEITLPSSVTSMDGSVFEGCTSLEKATLLSSITSIPYETFYGCTSLKEVTISSSITSIGMSAFHGCSSLTNFTIPSSAKVIGGSAFQGCSSLTEITIPSSVTSIGSHAFSGCKKLTKIMLPSSVKLIGQSAFGECTSLTEITIPVSVTTIEQKAFSGCTRLIEIRYDGMKSEWSKIENNFWCNESKIKKVICTDGEIEVK